MALPANQETNPILHRYLFSKQRAVYGKAKVNENIIYAEVKLFSSKETAANFRPESWQWEYVTKNSIA